MSPLAPTQTTQTEAEQLKQRIARFREVQTSIVKQVRRVIVGQEEVLEQVMIALFVGGHCLITGLPGTAKTLLVRTMAQTLERWRDRPEYRRLCELAASEPLVPDQAAASQELRQAVVRMLDSELRRRLEVLIEKARAHTLDESEKLELQALTVAQTRVGGP